MQGLGQAIQPPMQQQAQSPSADMQNASPEEQEQLSRFMAVAFELVYADETMPQVVEALSAEPHQESLANSAVSIFMRVLEVAQQAGQDISPDVKMQGAVEIIEDLADLAKDAGIKDYSQDRDALESAFFIALDRGRAAMEEAGMLDADEMQQDFANLQAQSESGAFEQRVKMAAEMDANGSAAQ